MIQKQQFDTEIFGIDFYRIKDFSNIEQLQKEINNILQQKEKIIIDAKINADNFKIDKLLQKYNFKKVCMQVELVFKINNIKSVKLSRIDTDLTIDNEIAKLHANNFIYDRFELDINIPKLKKEQLYSTWIKNTYKNLYISYIDNNFCSFKIINDAIKIDLLSVLDKGKGYAFDLMNAINNYALKKGINEIYVITECENKPAFNFYQKYGFQVNKFLSCWHYIK